MQAAAAAACQPYRAQRPERPNAWPVVALGWLWRAAGALALLTMLWHNATQFAPERVMAHSSAFQSCRLRQLSGRADQVPKLPRALEDMQTVLQTEQWWSMFDGGLDLLDQWCAAARVHQSICPSNWSHRGSKRNPLK